MRNIKLDPSYQFRNLKNLTIPELIPPLVNLVIIASVVLFVFSILLGGLKMILSGGNKEKTEEATRQIINAVIGITIVFSTWAIIAFLEKFFGVQLTTLQFPSIR